MPGGGRLPTTSVVPVVYGVAIDGCGNTEDLFGRSSKTTVSAIKGPWAEGPPTELEDLFETAFKTALAAQFTDRLGQNDGIDILNASSIIIVAIYDTTAMGLHIDYTNSASDRTAATALMKDTVDQNANGGGCVTMGGVRTCQTSPILTLVTKIQTSYRYEELGGTPSRVAHLSIREFNEKPYHTLIEKSVSDTRKSGGARTSGDDAPLFSAGTQTSASAFAIGSVFLLATALALRFKTAAFSI
jgi:hypothetical protein